MFATLLLPEIFFYGMAGMFTALLNVKHVFGPGAWAPVVNNVIAILTVGIFLTLPGPHTLLPSTMTNPQILVLGIGTTLGIAAQAAVLIPFVRRTGFRWKWRLRGTPDEEDRMKEAGSLTAWVLGYVAASQIGVVVIIKVAFGLSDGAVTNFTFADLLFQVPYGVLGVSLLTALMPRMSRSAARGEDRGGGGRPVSRRATLRRCPDSRDGRVHRSRPIAHHGVVHRADDSRRGSPGRYDAGLGGVRLASVRVRHAAAAGVLRDARRPDTDAREHLHGAGEDHPGSAGARGALRGRPGDRAERLHIPVLHRRRRTRPCAAHPAIRPARDFARWPGPSAGSPSQLLSPAQSHGAAYTSRT